MLEKNIILYFCFWIIKLLICEIWMYLWQENLLLIEFKNTNEFWRLFIKCIKCNKYDEKKKTDQQFRHKKKSEIIKFQKIFFLVALIKTELSTWKRRYNNQLQKQHIYIHIDGIRILFFFGYHSQIPFTSMRKEVTAS